ncbi:MAG: hypothetical protein AAF928_15460 [Myxococcota bacterium]
MRLGTDGAVGAAQLAAARAWWEGLVFGPRPATWSRDTRRVLVTGFSRFGEHARNASAELLGHLTPELTVPRFPPPPADRRGTLSPEPYFSAAAEPVSWSTADGGDVGVMAVIVPVMWDLAAAVVLRAIEHVDPEVVVMMGIAGDTQPLWIELGASNQTHARPDVTGHLTPVPDARVLPGGPLVEGHRASFELLLGAGRRAWKREEEVLGDVMPSVELVGFPRPRNAYVCNATAYVVAHALNHPRRELTLLEGSDDQRGVTFRFRRDRGHVPHVFLHWPSRLLAPPRAAAAARILRALIVAQLDANAAAATVHTGGDVRPTLWPTEPVWTEGASPALDGSV